MDTILQKANRNKPIIFDVQHDTSEIDGKHAIIQSHGLLLLIHWHISSLLTTACGKREAYAHKQVGHISVTLDLYTVAYYENSNRL